MVAIGAEKLTRTAPEREPTPPIATEKAKVIKSS
jgi:hypothetical protein